MSSGWSLPFVELLFNPDRRLIHPKQSTKWKRGLMRPWHTATVNSFHHESTSSEWKSREALFPPPPRTSCQRFHLHPPFLNHTTLPFIFPFLTTRSRSHLSGSHGGDGRQKKKPSCSCLRWFHHKPGLSFHNPCLGEFKGLFLEGQADSTYQFWLWFSAGVPLPWSPRQSWKVILESISAQRNRYFVKSTPCFSLKPGKVRITPIPE